MKKIIILLFIAASFHLGFSQKYTLELNLKPGDTYTQSFNANSTILQNINGMEMTIKMDIGGKIAAKILGLTGSTYDVEMQYTRMNMNMNIPNGGSMAFDTDTPDDSNPMSKTLGSLVGKPFSMKMTKSGRILEVTGIENLLSGIMDNMEGVDEMQKKQLIDQMMQSYGDKAIKGNLESGFAIFPETKVKVGDTWTVSTALESSMKADVKTEYTLSEVGKDYYLITGKGQITPIESENKMTTNGMEMTYSISGNLTSSIKIDKTTGWVNDGDIRMEMDMEMKIADSPQVPGGMTIPMQMDIQMKITK